MEITRDRLNELIAQISNPDGQSQISFSQSELCDILNLANRYFDIVGATPKIHEYYESLGKTGEVISVKDESSSGNCGQ